MGCRPYHYTANLTVLSEASHSWTILTASVQKACIHLGHWTHGKQTAELRFEPGHLMLPPTEHLCWEPLTPHRQPAALTPPPSTRPLTGSASGPAGLRLTLVLALSVILELT